MIIISAMSKDRVIGSGQGMPWNVPEEYEQYLNFVKGQTVIMGRTSYEIFGPDIDCGHNIVVSRSISEVPGAVVCSSIESAIEKAKSFGKTIFSAGGSSIYEQTIPLAQTMYLSIIKGDYKGDAYFPEFNKTEWRVDRHKDHEDFEFFVYNRKGDI